MSGKECSILIVGGEVPITQEFHVVEGGIKRRGAVAFAQNEAIAGFKPVPVKIVSKSMEESPVPMCPA